MPQYFLKHGDGNELGPLSADALKSLARQGEIDPDSTVIRAAGANVWHPARKVRGLLPIDSPSPPKALAEQVAPAGTPQAEPVAQLPAPLVHECQVMEVAPDVQVQTEPNEEYLRTAVASVPPQVQIQEDWFTPSGSRRTKPNYIAVAKNDYLNKSRTLKSSNYGELQTKIQEQVEKWRDQELKARVAAERKRLAQLASEKVDQLTRHAKTNIEAMGNLLRDSLTLEPHLNWGDYIDQSPFPEFAFESPPEAPLLPSEPRKPPENLADQFLPFLAERREKTYRQAYQSWQDRCRRMKQEWQQARVSWERRRQAAWEEYQAQGEHHRARQLQRNEAVARFRHQLAQGHPDAIGTYVDAVLSARGFPPVFPVSCSVSYDQPSKTIVVDASLPERASVSDVREYKFNRTTGRIESVCLTQKEHEQLYDAAVRQAVLRLLSQVFRATEPHPVETVVVNGWVTYLDAATGHDKTSCIISVAGDRSEIQSLALDRVDPAACIEKLKGIVAGPLSDIAPVRPILHLDRQDSRFVESHDVLAEYNSRTNLAEIGWEEFEHLVRELFSKLFSTDGAEVKVTQASSDGGVDAIAFDPDPIRGGKFVIQAKRYTNVVPVSAVRDLYGTMISEGASKGILVTTAHYGPDARKFVRDKPITLIDGSNLVYLLEQHGHKVVIDIEAARRNRERNPLAR